MAIYRKESVIKEVQRILPGVAGIAVTGSAAHNGDRFLPESDIDVIAIYSKNGWAWGEVDGHLLEINALRIEAIKRHVQNPQHHATNWIWTIGKYGGAELIFGGPNLENVVRSLITPRVRLVAGSTLVGALLNCQNKYRYGGRPQSLDVPLVLTALRRIVNNDLPLRAEADPDFLGFTIASDFTNELQSALVLAEATRDILSNNDEVQKLVYWSAHRTGLDWFRKAIGIDMEMPEVGYLD